MFRETDFIEGLKLSCTVQQDAQEFLKMYLTYIESELLKHSGVPPPLRNLVKDNFSGKYAYCTTCKKCKQKSEIEVPFYDLDLKVQGISRLEESLDDFFKIDILDGDNMYQCSACETCVKYGGGRGGLARCQGCGSGCVNCIKGGGGTACASRC